MADLVIRRPRGTRTIQARDVDYETVWFRDRTGKFEMAHWKHVVSYGKPTGPWFEGIDRVSARALVVAGSKGYDVKGIHKDGSVSRWVGVFYTFVVYNRVDPATARVFDASIDRMCIR